MKWLTTFLSSWRPVRGRVFEFSHQGGRQNNEDACAHLSLSEGTLMVLADGLGGHECGELASSQFCYHLLQTAKHRQEQLAAETETELPLLINTAVQSMREQIRQQAGECDAHTTCAIAWISRDNRITTAHIGDSRIYIFNHQQILWRSRDHSVVQMLVDLGEVDERDMASHPDQASLTRSVGMQGETRASVRNHGKFPGNTAVLLCSDGFWEQIRESEIRSMVKGATQQRLETLIHLAVKRGGTNGDNVTAQVYICP